MVEGKGKKILSLRDIGLPCSGIDRSFVILRLNEPRIIAQFPVNGTPESNCICVDASGSGEYFSRRFLTDFELGVLEPAESSTFDIVVAWVSRATRTLTGSSNQRRYR